VIVGLFMGILQMSEQALSENGQGKVPLVNPHTEIWYQVNYTYTVITYLIAISTLLQEVLVVFMMKAIRKQRS
jgi:hypothetical protein